MVKGSTLPHKQGASFLRGEGAQREAGTVLWLAIVPVIISLVLL